MSLFEIIREYEELAIARHNDKITLTVEEPWGGDSVTGLRLAASFNLTSEDIKELRDYLTRLLEEVQ